MDRVGATGSRPRSWRLSLFPPGLPLELAHSANRALASADLSLVLLISEPTCEGVRIHANKPVPHSGTWSDGSRASAKDGSSTSPGYRNIHTYFVNSTTSSMNKSSVWSRAIACCVRCSGMAHLFAQFSEVVRLGKRPTAEHATRGTPSTPFPLLAGNGRVHPRIPADPPPNRSARTANPYAPIRTKRACRHGAERQAA
jgi:hypothetical protein